MSRQAAALQRLNVKYADRLDCPISDETDDEFPQYFVDLKDDWTFAFQGKSGAFDTLKEVDAALKASRPIQ